MNIPNKIDSGGTQTLFWGNLEEQKELQQKITNLILPVAYTCQADSRKLSFKNQGLNDILGYEFDEINSWEDYLSLIIYKDDRDFVRKEMKRFYTLKQDETHAYSCRIVDKYGCIRHFSTRGRVLKWKGGGEAPELFLFVAIDITNDIARQNDYQLGLEKRLEELETSNKDLEEFAFIASHDLQEPLRKITSFGQRINADDKISNETRGDLTRMLNAAGNMKTLISDLLEFSRLTHSILAFENTDLTVLLDEVTAELETEIADSGTIIQAEKLPRLDVMPRQIKQLFSNIVLNAIKFRKPGQPAKITVTSSLLPASEKQNLQKDKDYYKICFADNGIGFKQEYAEKIFKMFQRLHARAEYPGTGVGLAICRRIADNHNGLVFAIGRPDEGATIVIVLPVKNKN